MQSHDPIQLEKDSSHPIVIPGAQEIINKTTDAINIESTAEISAPSTSEGSTQFAPDSFQTARSFKNSPTEYPFSTSHSSITNNNSQLISAFGSLRNSINTSPTTNFSPRLEGPLTGSISGHRNSITERANSGSLLQQQQQQQDTAGRRNILNSKFTSSSFQIPSYQQLHQQSTQFQQNHNGLSSSFKASSFVPNQPNKPPQPNLTSSHFQTNISSYTPYHNAPNTVSSSYSSANNSYQNNSFHSYAEQHSFNQPSSSTATTALRTERGGFDNLPSSRNGVEEPQQQPQQEQQQVDADNDTDMVDAPSDNNSNSNKRTTTESLLTSSLASITTNDTAVEDSSSITAHSKGDETLESVHLDIVNHPTEDLLIMLAALLQKIIEANDNLHPNHYTHAPHNQDGDSAHQLSNQHPENKFIANVLAFHGRNVPAISIQAYLSRILKYCPVTNEVFLTLLVYFDRIAKRANAGDFNTTPVKSEEEGHINDTPEAEQEKKDQLFVMDSYNIHRLIIAGVTVASKFFSDIFYKNSRYAKVGGLPLEELNHLEIQFLLLTDFKLLIQTEELQRYADLLLKFWAREQERSS